MTEEFKPITGNQLSYSSATLLKNCSQKYYYHKVAEDISKDPDAEENYDAFNVGKAFHWVMEENMHTDEDLVELLEKACNTFEVEDHQALIHAMLLRYLQVHTKSGLTAVFCELQLNTPEFLGFIDIVLEDKATGEWWIGDLKTASRFSEVKVTSLRNDVQLNLYASFAPWIAAELDLDVAKFRGARYRVTTKATLKRKVRESYYEYVRRLAKSVKSYDVVIPIEEMCPQDTFGEHLRLHAITMKMREGTVKPQKNLSYCDSFFKPCEYWSQCHGKTYSEMNGSLEILGSDNV